MNDCGKIYVYDHIIIFLERETIISVIFSQILDLSTTILMEPKCLEIKFLIAFSSTEIVRTLEQRVIKLFCFKLLVWFPWVPIQNCVTYNLLTNSIVNFFSIFFLDDLFWLSDWQSDLLLQFCQTFFNFIWWKFDQ